jgi:type II secretory pathway component PulK
VEAKARTREKGLALVLVLSLIGVIISMLAEVLFESEVVSRASVGERDRAKAEMAAITGAQLALFFVDLDSRIKALKASTSIPDGLKAGIDALIGGFEAQMGGRSIAQILNDFPIGSQGFESIESLTQLNLSKLADEKLIKALSAVPGYFVVNVSDESIKLNLNFLADRSLSKHMQAALVRLFSTTREKDFLLNFGIEPERLASNMLDYIDSDNKDSLESSDESGPYLQAKFSHLPKNGPLESLEELRRIPGFHIDEVYDVFSPYFTVWPMQADQQQWNIDKAPNELVAALTTPPNNEVNDPLMDSLEDRLAAGDTFGKSKEPIRDFKQFLSDGGITDKTTEELLRWLAGFESKVYKITVRGVSNQVERVYELVAIYEEVDLSPTKNEVPSGNGDGNQPPPSASPTPAPGTPNNESADKKKQSAPKQGKIRVVYQRFW